MRFSGPLLVAVLALAAPSAAHAALPLEVRGVTARNLSAGGVRVSFENAKAARLYRRIAGREVSVSCERVPRRAALPLVPEGDSASLESVLDAPRRGRVLRVGSGDRTRYDACRVQGSRRVRDGSSVDTRTVLDLWVPLTQRGAVHIDEQDVGVELGLVLAMLGELAREDGGRAYPPTPQAIERIGRDDVTPLADPDATPASGIGLYSDGAQLAVAVAVTASGRRVFIQANGDTMSSNLGT